MTDLKKPRPIEIHVLFPKQKFTNFNPFSNFLIPGSDIVLTMELTKQHIIYLFPSIPKQKTMMPDEGCKVKRLILVDQKF